MAYSVEVVSIGVDEYNTIASVIELLNVVQSEFVFSIPPIRLRDEGISFKLKEYTTREVFNWLEDYRKRAKGNRPYLVAVVPGMLSSAKLANLFGSHKAEMGLAVITTNDILHFVDSKQAYIAYYLTRYALSFINDKMKSHEDSRACYFDKKIRKADIKKSLAAGGSLCDPCTRELNENFNTETSAAFQQMADVAKALEENDKATINKLNKKTDEKRSKFSIPWWCLA